MARLLGQADATLVAAASKAAMANVPKDLSGIHARTGRAMQEGAKAIGEGFKSALEGAGKAVDKLVEANKAKAADAETDYKRDQLDWITDEEDFTIKDYTAKDQEKHGKLPWEEGYTEETAVKYDDEGKPIAKITDEKPSSKYYFTDNTSNKIPLDIRNVEEQIKEIRNERLSLKWLGENRKEYTKDERKVRREQLKIQEANLRNSAVGFRAYQERINTLLAMKSGEGINIAATGADNLTFATAVNNGGKPLEDGSRAIMGFTGDGKMVFNWVDKNGKQIVDKNGNAYSADMATIEDYIVVANPVARGAIDIAMNPKPHKLLGSKGDKYNPIPVKDAVNAIQGKNAYLDAVNYGKGMSASLAATLHGVKAFDENDQPIFGDTLLSTEVYATLNSLGDKYNYDGEGEVDAADFSTPGNYKKLINAILSGDDLELGKTVLKQHLHNENRIPYEEQYNKYLIDNSDVTGEDEHNINLIGKK